MQIEGNTIIDGSFEIHDLTQESVRLEKGNCAVYAVTRDKDLTVKLPKAADCFGAYVFVCLTSTYEYSASVRGVLTIAAATGDFIGTEPTATLGLTSAGKYALLVSVGIGWRVCTSN